MEGKSYQISSLPSMLAVSATSNTTDGSSSGPERTFRHRSYRIFRIERELLSGRHQSIVDPAHFEALWQAFKERSDPDQILLAGPRLGHEVSEPQVEVRSLDLYEAFAQGDA
jgi:hypothetical protein